MQYNSAHRTHRMCSIAHPKQGIGTMPNILTSIRIVCAVALVACSPFSNWFYALYLLGGISDVLDGVAARRLKKETPFGAKFDTVADLVFVVVVILKIVRAVKIPLWLVVWIVAIAGIKCVNVIRGFVLYKRFVSEHTVLNKLCGVLLFVIPFCIGWLPRLPLTILILLTCAAATVAAVQEGQYIRAGKEIE